MKTVIDYLHPLQKDSVRQLALVLGIHTETLNDWNTSNARAFLEQVVETWVRGQDGVEVATWKRLVEGVVYNLILCVCHYPFPSLGKAAV